MIRNDTIRSSMAQRNCRANSPGVELTCGLPNTKKLYIFIILLFEMVLVFCFSVNGNHHLQPTSFFCVISIFGRLMSLSACAPVTEHSRMGN